MCAQCGRDRRGGEHLCPCGSAAYTARLEATDLERQTEPEIAAAWPARAPLDRFVPDGGGLLILLWGPSGVGKTTLAYRLFDAPYIISAEMGLGRVAAYCRRLRVKPAGVVAPERIEDELGERWDLRLPRDHMGPVVLDSLTRLGPAGAADALGQLDHYRQVSGAPVVLINQATKDGASWGSTRLHHDVDVVVGLGRDDSGRRFARVEKNRVGAEGDVSFRLDVGGAAEIDVTRCYSVESGRGGALRLVAWPDHQAKWAGPYELAEKSTPEAARMRARLAGGGWACAARASRLAVGGWATPEDIADRRAYAESHGLAWFEPGGDDGE